MLSLAWVALVPFQDVATVRPANSPMFGSILTALGDVDGDEIADFAVGDSGWQPDDVPAAWWIISAKTGVVLGSFFSDEDANGFPLRMLDAGDLDGDGCAELWLMRPTKQPETRLDLWSVANKSALRAATESERDRVLVEISKRWPLGDFDGDGVLDRWRDDGKSQTIVSGVDERMLWLSPVRCDSFVPLQDLDGDGRAEILCADSERGLAQGAVELRTSGTSQVLWTVGGGDAWWYFGYGIDAIGDSDGDGVRDWIVGSWNGHSPWPGGLQMRSGKTGEVLMEFARRVRVCDRTR